MPSNKPRSKSRKQFVRIAAMVVAFFVLLTGLYWAWRSAPWNAPARLVQQSWKRAHQADSYRFNTEIVQTDTPLPLPENVGLRSSQQFVHLEGQASLPTQGMSMTLTQAQNTSLDQASGMQFKVENGKAYQRQGDQEDWQETNDFSGMFAPQGDLLAFLSAAQSIRKAAPGEACPSLLPNGANPPGSTCYRFDVNGPRFAAYVRDHMEAGLAKQGKLPPGVELGLADVYTKMTGKGSLWLGSDQLPMALIMELEFPPNENDEMISVVVTSSFLDYQFTSPSAANIAWGLGAALRNLDPRLGWGVLLLSLAVLFLIEARRSKRVYAALSVTLIVAMLVGPLLQQVKAADFYAEQSADQQTQQARTQQQEAQRQAQEKLTAPSIQPNLSPLEQAQNKRQVWLALKDASEQPLSTIDNFDMGAEQAAISEYLELMADPGKDTDKDGLPDAQEVLLGSNPENKDTDRDGVEDGDEVKGFVICNKTWYGDPNSADTNSDGLADKLEWNKDTDNDCTPDLWSRDNDGDGVPDQIDLSPVSWNKQDFSPSSPLSLKVDLAEKDRIMYLDVQVRPSDVKQLDYPSIVLKWPSPDVKGQMTDFDGKTFRDVTPDSSDHRDAFGNVKLIPALEVIVDNPELIPPKSVYTMYGAVVKDLVQNSKQKVMTVPLIQQEENNGHRVAFQARLPLKSASSWGKPLVLRPVWLANALVDTCKDDKWKDGKCTEVDKYNQPSIIQVYPMTAKLTGLNLRENHGTDFAVLYPDPRKFTSNPQQINKLDTLAAVADGLGKSFATGRVNANQQRDFMLADIRNRFDNTVNSQVPITPTRFAISENIFRVELFQNKYKHPDEASANLSVTETMKLLHGYDPLWSASQPITPTLLFAQEDRFRALNLDALDPRYNNVTWSGQQLNLVLSSTANDPARWFEVPEGLTAYMNWGSYVHTSDAKMPWKPCTLSAFLNYLRLLYPPGELDTDPQVAKGMQVFLDLYYRNLFYGVGGVVMMGGKPTPAYYETDTQIASNWKKLENLKLPLKLMANGIIQLVFNQLEIREIMRLLGQTFSEASYATGRYALSNLSPRQWRLWKGIGFAAKWAGVIMFIAGLALFILKMLFANDTWAVWVGNGIMGVLAIAFVVTQFLTFYTNLKLLLYGARYASSYFPGGAKGCLWFALAMTILLFAYLICQMIAGKISWNSVQFWQMTTYIIVTIVMMIAMIVIEMIPIVGPLLVLLLTILSAIAQLTGLPVDPIGMFIELVVNLFYVANPISGPDAKSEKTKMELEKTDQGMQVGNNILMNIEMTNANKASDPPSWQLWRFSEDWDWRRDGHTNIPRMTLKQKLSQTKRDVPASSLDEQSKQWSNWHEDHLWDKSGPGFHVWAHMYNGSMAGAALGTIPLKTAGVDTHLDLKFNYSYALPARRCALTFICKIVQYDDKTSSDIQNMFFDVFPATVDEFVAWKWLAGEVGEGEEQDLPMLQGAPYPRPMDADGDGLISQGFGGNDPNDSKWDTDGDGLSDYFEMTTGQWAGGGALDPNQADSDGDGLNDADEVRLSCDPRKSDTDGDGLLDKDEAAGYDFTYSANPVKKVHVYTSCNSPDTDRDGIMDGAEVRLHNQNPALYPYNPAAWNLNPLSVTVSMTNPPYPDGYVKAGWNGPLNLKRSVSNVGAVVFDGSVHSEIPLLSGGGNIPDKAFKFLPGQAITETFTIDGFNRIETSKRVEINTLGCANLVNPLFVYTFNHSPWFNNEIGSTYSANPITNHPVGLLPGMSDAAPGTIGYSLAFSPQDIGSKSNGLWTSLNASYSGPFSLAAWVNTTPPQGGEPRGPQTAFEMNTSSGVEYSITFNRTYDSKKGWNIIFSLGKPVNQQFTFPWGSDSDPVYGWAHLAIVYDGKLTQFYVNGDPVGSIAGALERTGGTLQTGYSTLGAQPWKGLIDEVYFYDMAVNDLLIKRLANRLSGDSGGTCNKDLEVQANVALYVDADNPSAAVWSLAQDQYINTNGVLVVGGHASDPTSPVAGVDFQVDNGAWNVTGGKENWAYNWNTASSGEGYHTLSVRATDIVGHVGGSTARRIIIDRTPPRAEVLSVPGTAELDGNTWYLRLYGSVTDPKAGSANGSGPASLEVRLVQEGQLDGGFQLAELDADKNYWSINYRLPTYVGATASLDPAGHYQVYLRAGDAVGNSATYTATSFDLFRPQARFDLGGETPMGQVISNTVTVTGMVTDTSKTKRGVQNARVAFIPQETMYALNGATALLHMDDPSSSKFFVDHSGKNNGASCIPPACPSAHQEGKFDYSAEFDGARQYLTLYPPLASGSKSFSISFWLYVARLGDHDNRFVAGQVNQANDATPGAWWVTLEDSLHMSLSYVLQDGAIKKSYFNGDILGDWRHVIVRIWHDGVSMNGSLWVNGAGQSTNWISDYTYPSNLPIRLGGAPGARDLHCWIDEVTAFPFLLSGEQANALNSWKDVRWLDASLDHRGSTSTKWSLGTPGDLLDNFYVISGRAQVGNSQDYGFLPFQALWSGIVDLQKPVVTTGHTLDYSYCTATDLNLAPDSYHCGSYTASNSHWTYYHQVSEWYRSVTTDTTRLYKLESAGQIRPLEVRACDRYNHCNTKTGEPEPGEPPPYPLLSQVVSPTVITDSLAAVDVTTYAYAQDSLALLSATVNGAPFGETTWADPGITETNWVQSWTPPAEGRYDFVSSAVDFNGRVQTETITSTIYVDLGEPEIEIATQAITVGNLTDSELVRLAGAARDAAGLMQVELDIDGGGWQPAALTDLGGGDYAWELLWPPASHEPSTLYADGQPVNVTARAFDAAWREAQAVQSVTIDLLPPEPVTMTVSYQNGGDWVAIAPGDKVSSPLNPNLRLEWTEAADASGLSAYYAGFLEAGAALDLGSLTPFDPTAARQYTQSAGEAKAYYAYVAAIDRLGNLRWNAAGPFVVDTPQTPDYLSLTPLVDSLPAGMPARQYGMPNNAWQGLDGIYRGWIDAQASLLGVSRAADERLDDVVSRSKPQSLSLSWDAQGLRLNWTGANWSTDGDLVIYLNAGDRLGGTMAFDPFAGTTPLTVTLPGAFNYAVWVPETDRAVLLGWDGGAWAEIQTLGADQFHFTHAYSGGLTDLYLPFTWLGVADPGSASLDLLALAVDASNLVSPALEIWAALPVDNPLNLWALNGPAAPAVNQEEIQLISLFHWDTLALGTLPGQGKYQDIDLRMDLNSDPLGAQQQSRPQGMAWAWAAQPVFNGVPLGDGQQIHYTAVISNTGSLPAEDVRLLLRSKANLVLLGGGAVAGTNPVEYEQTLALGDIPAGQAVQAGWDGLVDMNHNLPTSDQPVQARLELQLMLGDQRVVENGAIWHWVDTDPPVNVEVSLPLGQENNQPLAPADLAQRSGAANLSPASPLGLALDLPPVYVRPGAVTVWGKANDPAGVSKVVLEVIDQSFNSAWAMCSFTDLVNSTWQCPLNPPVTGLYAVRASATDAYNHASAPSAWRLFIVDDEAPEVTLQPEIDQLVQTGPLNRSMEFFGGLTDEYQSSQLELCAQAPEPLQRISLFFPLLMNQGGGAASSRPATAAPDETPAPATSCVFLDAYPGNTSAADWWYDFTLPAGLDGYTQLVSLYGIDAAGNRSLQPVNRLLRLDNVPPQVSVTIQRLEISLAEFQQAPFAVLRGQATDGGGYPIVNARLDGPRGSLLEPVAQTGNLWSYTPSIAETGDYLITIRAMDPAGNQTLVGIFELVVR